MVVGGQDGVCGGGDGGEGGGGSGLFGEKEEEEEDGGGGVVVVVVVEMKEEMEEKRMVELVVEMEVEKWRMGGQRREHGCFCSLPFVGCCNKEEERRNMKEREERKVGVVIYKGK